jgi:hypothetical protein
MQMVWEVLTIFGFQVILEFVRNYFLSFQTNQIDVVVYVKEFVQVWIGFFHGSQLINVWHENPKCVRTGTGVDIKHYNLC